MSDTPVIVDDAVADGSRKGSLPQTVKAVAWAFFGIRKNSDYQSDLGKLNPFHLIAVAGVGVALGPILGGFLLEHFS